MRFRKMHPELMTNTDFAGLEFQFMQSNKFLNEIYQ